MRYTLPLKGEGDIHVVVRLTESVREVSRFSMPRKVAVTEFLLQSKEMIPQRLLSQSVFGDVAGSPLGIPSVTAHLGLEGVRGMQVEPRRS